MKPCSATLGLLGFLGAGCQSGQACPTFCLDSEPATFDLSCSGSDLTDVTLSGPCSSDHDAANPSTYLSGRPSLGVGSLAPGDCHVTLTFGTGFVYSADVMFVLQTDPEPSGCPACPAYVVPTQRSFMVNNPGATCIGVDASADATDAATTDAVGDTSASD